MKKLFTSILLLSVISLGFGQRSSSLVHTSGLANHPFKNNSRSFSDTLVPGSFDMAPTCTFSIYHVGNDADSGYVVGNNAYGDLEKMQLFDPMNYHAGPVAGNMQVTDVLMWCGVKREGLHATLKAKVYGGDETNGPAGILGTSDTISMGSVDTTGGLTLFHFSTAAPVTGKFFASIVLPTVTGDTIGLVCTTDPCTEVTSFSWEKWNTGAFHSFVDMNNWGLDVDLAIFAVVQHDNALGILNTSEINIAPLMPNPANNTADLKYALRTNSSLVINIYDVTGQLVYSSDKGKINTGIYKEHLNVSTFSNGLYTVEVCTNTTKAITKLVVAH